MSRQGKVEAFEYIADADLAASGGLAEGPKTKINIENLAAGAVPDASTTVKGKVELATVAEAEAGTDTTRAVTPEGVAAAIANNQGIKKYVALLTQTGTNAPVATVLENTLGEVPVWSYDGEGEFLLATSNPVLTENKTAILIGSTLSGNGNQAQAIWQSTTGLYVATYSGGAPANGFLNDTVIDVRVFP